MFVVLCECSSSKSYVSFWLFTLASITSHFLANFYCNNVKIRERTLRKYNKTPGSNWAFLIFFWVAVSVSYIIQYVKGRPNR